MGKTMYVSITTNEYAELQRIVGLAHACVRQVPGMYQGGVAPLRRAIDEYEARLAAERAPRVTYPRIGTAA